MARINLLPWREELRKEQQRQFLTITGLSVILMILIILAVHIQIAGMANAQQRRNQYITKEIKNVEIQIKEIERLEKDKQSLQARIDIIQRLQRNRPEIVHLFDEIARILPQGLYLSSIKQEGRTLTINGLAQSNARVSAFMRNIEASDWLDNPVLDIIKLEAKSDDNYREFILKCTQVSKSRESKK